LATVFKHRSLIRAARSWFTLCMQAPPWSF
jgi:hypothetical protein